MTTTDETTVRTYYNLRDLVRDELPWQNLTENGIDPDEVAQELRATGGIEYHHERTENGLIHQNASGFRLIATEAEVWAAAQRVATR